MELELKFTEVTGCEPVGDLVTTQEIWPGSWTRWVSCGCGKST